MYLDSVRIKGVERPPRVLPRVKAYDCVILRRMIEADQANSSASSSKKTWGSNLVCIFRKLSLTINTY